MARVPHLKQAEPVALQGLVYRELQLDAPLDHFGITGSEETLQVFAREVWSPAHAKGSDPKHYLCFFQGGPGFQSPAPSEHLAWLTEACKHFKVILLDQRGTGLSSPVTVESLAARGSVTQQVEYLRFFRADSIVEDAEWLRMRLHERDSASEASNKRGAWSILGQSFGGFCCVQYLSKYPQALLEAFLTGGLAPKIDMTCAADTVYQHTYPRLITQNEKYYQRFPMDMARVREIVQYLASQPDGGVVTPAGSVLRPRTLQLLGLSGMQPWAVEEVSRDFTSRSHPAFDRSGEKPRLTPTFLKSFDASLAFDTNPLYAVLHEHCYTKGPGPRWSAMRIMAETPEFAAAFDPEACLSDDKKPFYFTGEMVFPWMFDDLAGLRPLKEVAGAAAEYDGWTDLYSEERLLVNEVPCAAASYVEDMYVDFKLASETASKIRGMRQWMTNEYMHSGIRDNGSRIFERLLGMTRGTYMLF